MNAVDKLFKEANGDVAVYTKLYGEYLSSLLEALDKEAVAKFVAMIIEAREHGSKIIFLGNGGSAATASHFANDIGIGTRLYKRPFKAISLTDNNAVMTAIGNDDGYENLFVRQMHVNFEPGDLVVGISASGNSENVLRALDYANENGGKTVAILGFDGGKCLDRVDHAILIRTSKGEFGPVEDMHMILDHMIGNYLMRAVSE